MLGGDGLVDHHKVSSTQTLEPTHDFEATVHFATRMTRGATSLVTHTAALVRVANAEHLVTPDLTGAATRTTLIVAHNTSFA